MRFRISVALTILNEVKTIGKIIESLLSQSRKPDEIVIVDGGSTDGTIGLLEEFAVREKSIKVIVAKGANISEGRNIAISHAKYPVIAVTDGGCWPDEKWLEKIAEPFDTDPSVDAVKGVFKSEPRSLFEYFSGLLTLAGHLEEEIDENHYPMSGRSSAFRKTIWEKAGGYPEWLYTAEDTLFYKKLKKIRAKILLASKAIVYWRPRQNIQKMAKMYFLYGRGNGRIGESVCGAYYHLRNYLIMISLLIFSVFYPIMYIPFAAISLYFHFHLFRASIKRVKKKYKGWKLAIWTPIIVTVRTIAYNAGLVLGNYEYKHKYEFKRNLNIYLPE